MPVHQCPICGAVHDVHPVLHALAYGRQLTCSPRCKARWPAFVWAGLQAARCGDGAYSKSKADSKDEVTAC